MAQPTLKSISQAGWDDLLSAGGLLVGSPNWSGISDSVKSWLDGQGDLREEVGLEQACQLGARLASVAARLKPLNTRYLVYYTGA